jgi:hypothetical protein
MRPAYPIDQTKRWTLVSLLVIVPLGLYTKFYTGGPAASWVNDSLSGVFYVIFWCLLVFLFIPAKPGLIAAGVFVVTSLLEILQLVHHPALEFIRGFFLGRVLIGTVFVWSDFIYYVLGYLLGWPWLQYLSRTRSM